MYGTLCMEPYRCGDIATFKIPFIHELTTRQMQCLRYHKIPAFHEMTTS